MDVKDGKIYYLCVITYETSMGNTVFALSRPIWLIIPCTGTKSNEFQVKRKVGCCCKFTDIRAGKYIETA